MTCKCNCRHIMRQLSFNTDLLFKGKIKNIEIDNLIKYYNTYDDFDDFNHMVHQILTKECANSLFLKLKTCKCCNRHQTNRPKWKSSIL